MRRSLKVVFPVFVGLAAFAALYARLLAPGTAYVERDISGLHLPMLEALATAAADGIPSWNPLVHGGQPLLANPHYASFYPPMWLVAVVPPHTLIGWLVFMHAAFAAAGTWKLTRHWGCGAPAAAFGMIAFVGGSAYCSTSSMLNLFMGLSWMPWALLWGDRALQQPRGRAWLGDAARLGLVLAAQLLTGSPETALLTVLALGCLALELAPDRWRHSWRLLPIGLVGLGVAAVQIVPTLRHLAASARTTGLDAATATTWSTPPVRLLELLWPRLFGDLSRGEFFLYFGYPGSEQGVPLILSLYCGGLVLALAAAALRRPTPPRRRALLAMALLGVFLGLGRYNPLYSAVLVELPPFSLIRFPEKFMFLTTTAVALLAALGWQRLLAAGFDETRKSRRLSTMVATGILVVTVILYLTPIVAPQLALDLLRGVTPEVVEWQGSATGPSGLPDDVLLVRAGLLGRELFVSMLLWGGALILLLLHARQRFSRPVLTTLVLVLLAVDVGYYGWRQNRPVPATEILEPPVGLTDLPPARGRVFSDAILFGNQVLHLPDPRSGRSTDLARSLARLDPYTANLWGYGYALNSDPDLMLTRPAQQALAAFVAESGLRQRGWSERAYRLLGVWNVGIVVRRRSPSAQLEERDRTGRAPVPARLLPNPEVLPRYRMVTRITFASDRGAALQAVRAVDFRLADFDAVIRNSQGEQTIERRYDAARIHSSIEESHRVVIEYEAAAPAFLVVAVTMDRDWRARVDGRQLPIFPTALGQMGIELPEGRRRLELAHRNPAVLWVLPISALLLGLCATAIVARPGERHD